MTAQLKWLSTALFRLTAKVRLDAELPWHLLAENTRLLLKPIGY
ncbi:MAG: hypothetical protein VYE46_04210 [Cyanobacteriota bacterium]|nr:hypothetical protein [Cyanobacteriota bacterium]